MLDRHIGPIIPGRHAYKFRELVDAVYGAALVVMAITRARPLLRRDWTPRSLRISHSSLRAVCGLSCRHPSDALSPDFSPYRQLSLCLLQVYRLSRSPCRDTRPKSSERLRAAISTPSSSDRSTYIGRGVPLLADGDTRVNESGLPALPIAPGLSSARAGKAEAADSAKATAILCNLAIGLRCIMSIQVDWFLFANLLNILLRTGLQTS